VSAPIVISPDREGLARAAEALLRGALVAFPTETVYGLGAHALDARAVEGIFLAKGRPSYNPLIVHVHEAAAARTLATIWPRAAERLAEAFWPGPLTLVLPKRDSVPDVVTAGLGSVALRVPAHPVALALLREAAIPVAAPSANRSMQVSPTTAAHVARSLGGRVELIVDGGATPLGIESTVLDLTGPDVVLLRPGTLTVPEIEDVLGARLSFPAPAGAAHTPRPSPGMLDRHYAPRAPVRLLAAGELPRVAEEHVARGERTGALLIHASEAGIAHPVRMHADASGYASHLYAALHMLDDLACDVILVERPPAAPEWAGVNDRLRRAATP
jgi:L-threonylcarbamoyladenylate synthase